MFHPTPQTGNGGGAAPTLPDVLPIFPLTGSLLLPGNWLPLNIFEPRYCALVEDALGGTRMLGMIQPVVPRQDNRPDPMFVDEEAPAVYSVGCAGRIERCEPQDDGRYLILLKGISRFRVREELDERRGYRRVRADFSEFAADVDEPEQLLDPDPILTALRRFARSRELDFDIERLETLSGVTLLNGLAVALPFSPGEKQALLEADGPDHRRDLLLSLMGMGFSAGSDGDLHTPPTVH
jgi:hypothetical protein